MAGFAADTGELWHYCSEVCKRSLRISGLNIEDTLFLLVLLRYYSCITHEEIFTYKNNNFKCRYEVRFSFLF